MRSSSATSGAIGASPAGSNVTTRCPGVNPSPTSVGRGTIDDRAQGSERLERLVATVRNRRRVGQSAVTRPHQSQRPGRAAVRVHEPIAQAA